MSAVVTFLLILTIKNLLFVDYRVEGVSMQPTLTAGHLLSINKVNHRLFDLKRFDIVVFQPPGEKRPTSRELSVCREMSWNIRTISFTLTEKQ